jgi:transposase-like protein
MVVGIAGKRMYLWCAVDHEGVVLDMLVQRRRNTQAAFFAEKAEALIGSDKINPLVEDFDRAWGDRVTRRVSGGAAAN